MKKSVSAMTLRAESIEGFWYKQQELKNVFLQSTISLARNKVGVFSRSIQTVQDCVSDLIEYYTNNIVYLDILSFSYKRVLQHWNTFLKTYEENMFSGLAERCVQDELKTKLQVVQTANDKLMFDTRAEFQK